MELLKYDIFQDRARTFLNQKGWEAIAGGLKSSQTDNILSVMFINQDHTNKRSVEVCGYELAYGQSLPFNSPSAGGSIDLDSIKIKFNNGDSSLVCMIQRAVNFRAITI